MNLADRNRRQFIRFLAGSPLLAEALAQDGPAVLSDPKSAINVMDFEAAAKKALPPAHWGYLASGVEDDVTLRLNREAYGRFQLRPHRLIDVSRVDTKVDLFGTSWETPIFICPVGSQKAFHPEGEIATAKAARAKHHLQILSTQTSSSVEDVAQALGTPPWYQLYMPTTWASTEKLVKRVEDAGCPALVWTVDVVVRATETAERARLLDKRDCTECHSSARGGAMAVPKPMYRDIPVGFNSLGMTWDHVDRLRKLTKMKLLIKGLETGEDAKMARERGADGIIVSNHGGRATEDLRPTIESLAEVVKAVGPDFPVMVDGGVRRGSDVFKALALGARAVGIGRPYAWGLSAFGQQGVERVLDIFRAEFLGAMRQCGVTSVKQITGSYIARV